MASVLIVDDDPVSRMMLKHILASDGHEVVEAADGAEAFEVLGGSTFDLIISDEEMPNMSGRHLRAALGEDLDIPFVLLTGTMLPEDEVGTGSGFDACLTKPVGSVTLNDLVSSLLATQSHRQN